MFHTSQGFYRQSFSFNSFFTWVQLLYSVRLGLSTALLILTFGWSTYCTYGTIRPAFTHCSPWQLDGMLWADAPHQAWRLRIGLESSARCILEMRSCHFEFHSYRTWANCTLSDQRGVLLPIPHGTVDRFHLNRSWSGTKKSGPFTVSEESCNSWIHAVPLSQRVIIWGFLVHHLQQPLMSQGKLS